MQCHQKKAAPQVMLRGSAATDHQYAYFTSYNSIHASRFEWSTEKWEAITPYPYLNSSLTIINGALTAVGGRDNSYRYTNKLFTLRQARWIEEYPPMITARSHTAVISTPDGKYIFAIGGNTGHWTTVVEMFEVRSTRWHLLTTLPKGLLLTRPSAAICGNQLYVIGLEGFGCSCSLQALPAIDKPIKPQPILHIISWVPLPRLPVGNSTATTLAGKLVIVGGSESESVNWSQLNSIHQLVDGQWVQLALCLADGGYL